MDFSFCCGVKNGMERKSCYWPFQVHPQQGSSCLVSVEPIEQTKSRSEVKENSFLLIKWRGATSRSRAHTRQAGGGWGCLLGFLSEWGGGAEFSWGSRGWAAQAPGGGAGCNVCTRPAAAILNGLRSWGVGTAVLHQELWSEGPGKASVWAPTSKWN